jgi:hypothetical protein
LQGDQYEHPESTYNATNFFLAIADVTDHSNQLDKQLTQSKKDESNFSSE